jgi:SAM-dependent methyltransferase
MDRDRTRVTNDDVTVGFVDQGGSTPGASTGSAAVFSRPVLALYDFGALGLANTFAWKCPTRALRDLYDANVSASHLDVGVGTGYFLDRCRFPSKSPRIVLADLSTSSLQVAARRIRRFQPRAYCVDVLAPFTFPEAPFDSIGVSYLLHCLPGTFRQKGVVFDQLRRLLSAEGVVFGATLLGSGIARGAPARALAAFLNWAGVFDNTGDDLGGLEDCLLARFSRVEICVHGCAALFTAREPKPA